MTLFEVIGEKYSVDDPNPPGLPHDQVTWFSSLAEAEAFVASNRWRTFKILRIAAPIRSARQMAEFMNHFAGA